MNLIKRSLVEPFRIRELKPSLEKDIPILIYQMGKVASTSIFKSLQAVHGGWVIQLHDHQPDQYTRRKLKRRMVFDYALKEGKPIKVITLTREPVGRNIACLFENFIQNTGRAWADPDINVELLRQHFMKEFDHNEPLRWFDENLKAHFGIDCYSKEFSGQGYQYYENGPVSVLAMQCELPDDLKARMVGDFVGISDFTLKNANVGSKKPYSGLYGEFKDTVRFPEAYMKRMCESRYFRHFYCQDIIDKTWDRWIEK